MPIQTSLRPDVLNRLPIDKKGRGIYHRPLIGSSLLLKGGPGESINRFVGDSMKLNGKKVINPQAFRTDEWDNPHINALTAFDGRPMADNFWHTRRLVLAFNHPTRRDHNRVGEYRIAYYESLADCNMCYYCKLPIQVRSARITGDSRKQPEKPKKEGVQLQFAAKEDKPEKFGTNAKMIRSVHGKKLRGVRYKPQAKPNNKTYGDIKSHFRYVPYANNEGVTKYRFQYFDGSGRRIEQRKRPSGISTYFVEVLADGAEKEIIPQNSYRITDKRCKCGKRGK